MSKEKTISDLANRFLSILKVKEITAYKLSKEVPELSQQKISNIKTGFNEPSRDVINAILKKYPDISSDWLISGNGPMFSNIDTASFKVHKDKPNILDTYSIDDVVSFMIENENLIKKNSPLYKKYLQSLEQKAINSFLLSHIKNP